MVAKWQRSPDFIRFTAKNFSLFEVTRQKAHIQQLQLKAPEVRKVWSRTPDVTTRHSAELPPQVSLLEQRRPVFYAEKDGTVILGSTATRKCARQTSVADIRECKIDGL